MTEDHGLLPVTGEAVVLDLRPASFVTRGLALLVDITLLIVLLVIMNSLLAVNGSFDESAGAAIALVSSLAILVGTPVLVETLTRGRSLGKLLAGLRVVRDDGGPVRARHALIRGLLAFLEVQLTLGILALFASMINSQGKRFGDMLAGTYVIRERAPAEPYVALEMPPALAGWASGADLGRIPTGLAVSVRQYIGRSASLAAPARDHLGADLLQQLSQYVAPPPPRGAPTVEVLMAVLVERRRRDHERLSRLVAARDQREQHRRRATVLTDASTPLAGPE